MDAVIARARAAGVSRMVAIGSGYGAGSGGEALRVASRHPDVWCTIGLHPHDAKHWGAEVEASMRAVAAHPRCVGLGEMGLDFYYEHSAKDEQRAALRAQVRLARELGKPIVIHDRDSEGEVLSVVAAEGGFAGTVLWHCYTGDVPYMESIVAAGGFVSIPGIVTFKNAGHLPEVAKRLPIDRMLIETDSPFLAPVPHRGRTNEPANVPLVAAKIAELRGMPVDEVARVTTENARRVFGLG